MRRPLLVVMAREPRAGRVKTRLARGIGAVRATWWYRHQVRRTLRALKDPRWRLVLAVTPDLAAHSRVWAAALPRLGQGGGDLGARMARLLDIGGPVLVIGSDIPGISRAHVGRAARALGGHDAVLGPATDGGFWLIGWAGRRRLGEDALAAVRWSGPHAMADTMARLPAGRVALVDVLRDVDEAADLP